MCESHLLQLFVFVFIVTDLFGINPAGETPAPTGGASRDRKTNVPDTAAVLSSQSNLTFSSQQLPFLTRQTDNLIKRDLLQVAAPFMVPRGRVSFNFRQVLNRESDAKRIQYVTQVTSGPLIVTIHRHVLLAHFVARN